MWLIVFAPSLGPNDIAIRYGGDEFVLLCPDITNVISAERIATRVLQAIEAPFQMGDEVLELSACIGAAVTEERRARSEEVLADADAAMHQAKEKGAGPLLDVRPVDARQAHAGDRRAPPA